MIYDDADENNDADEDDDGEDCEESGCENFLLGKSWLWPTKNQKIMIKMMLIVMKMMMVKIV